MNVQISEIKLIELFVEVDDLFNAYIGYRKSIGDAPKKQVAERAPLSPGGTALIDMNCTRGGMVGASVIATRTRPRSQAIIQSPRKAFSTEAKPDPAAQAPT